MMLKVGNLWLEAWRCKWESENWQHLIGKPPNDSHSRKIFNLILYIRIFKTECFQQSFGLWLKGKFGVTEQLYFAGPMKCYLLQRVMISHLWFQFLNLVLATCQNLRAFQSPAHTPHTGHFSILHWALSQRGHYEWEAPGSRASG